MDFLEDEINFYQCNYQEKSVREEVSKAVTKLQNGEQFAFYDLNFPEHIQQTLSEITITNFNNIAINNNSFDSENIQKILANLNGFSSKNHDIIANLIARTINIIDSQVDSKKLEVTIRTREGYCNENNCIYWHLDKSSEEIYNEKNNIQELRFIIPLKGAGTNYQKINLTTRNKFLEISEEAPHYYGHGVNGCVENDVILNLLNPLKIYKTKTNLGSVHLAGINGTMHAAPELSSDRVLILITAHVSDNQLT